MFARWLACRPMAEQRVTMRTSHLAPVHGNPHRLRRMCAPPKAGPNLRSSRRLKARKRQPVTRLLRALSKPQAHFDLRRDRSCSSMFSVHSDLTRLRYPARKCINLGDVNERYDHQTIGRRNMDEEPRLEHRKLGLLVIQLVFREH